MTRLASLEISILVMAAFAAITSTAIASPELEQLTAEEQRARWQAAIATATEEKEAEAFKVFDILAEQQQEQEGQLEGHEQPTLEQVQAAIDAKQAELDDFQRKQKITVVIIGGMACIIVGLILWQVFLILSALLSYRKTKMAEWEARRKAAAFTPPQRSSSLDKFGAE